MMRDSWDRVELAVRLLATGERLGGLWLRGRAGPVRDAVLAALHDALPGLRKIGPATGDDALEGALDVTASLTAGHRVERSGLLASNAPILLTSGERCTPGRAARLAAWVDAGGTLVLLDEGAEEDELPPDSLTDRLACFLDLEGLRTKVVKASGTSARQATASDDDLVALTTLSARLGIAGLRAPLFALEVARQHAGLAGRAAVEPTDLEAATEMVLTHRATVLPSEEDVPNAPPPPPESGEREGSETPRDLTEERLIAAAETALPPDVMAELMARRSRTKRSAGGAGAVRTGTARGRPLPARRGRPDGRARIDLIATLRAAAPWQTIRGRTDRVEVRRNDIHLTRKAERASRLVIFLVDASGSAAMARMAEAKGAVSLLLGEAYRSRDSVALIAFRGERAEVLLPPTKALVAAKRRLSALPGGGATPLADALRQAASMAEGARRSGADPLVVLMSDGRGNRALDGALDRAQASEETLALAGLLRSSGARALCLDTGRRASPALAEIARVLDAPCLPLPRGGAAEVAALAKGA